MKKSLGDVMKDTIRDVLASYYALMPVMIDEDLVTQITKRVFTVCGISDHDLEKPYEGKVQCPSNPVTSGDGVGKRAQKRTLATSGKFITIQVDLIDEIRKEISENRDFNPEAWCESDAVMLKKAARIIEEGLKVKTK